MISVWPCSEAHIKAVVPRRVSLALTRAPWSEQQFDRVFIPGARGQHQSGFSMGKHGSVGIGTCLQEFLDHGVLPLRAARNSGVAPSRLGASTLAPERIRRSAASRSAHWAAQCRAVVPSAWGRFTSAFFWIRAQEASWFLACAASATSLDAASGAD